jgi:hypothetical protein
MIGKKNKILVWLLTWAGLLLVVLYSPLGSPDLYQSSPAFAINQGVSFSGSKIINVPKSNNTSSGESQDIGLPAIPNSNSYSYSTGGSRYAGNGAQSGINSMRSSGSVILHVNQQETGSSSMGAVNFAAGFTNHSSGSNSVGDNGISSAIGFTSSQFNLLATNNPTTRQAASASTSSNTDPGGDPKGNPIPVPDGWGFLLSLSVVYLLIKKYFK